MSSENLYYMEDNSSLIPQKVVKIPCHLRKLPILNILKKKTFFLMKMKQKKFGFFKCYYNIMFFKIMT